MLGLSLQSPGALGPSSVRPQPSASPHSEAERRHLTVVFCDLVGSTTFAERHDPEDFREVVSSFLVCCADVAKRFDGYVARYMGDGLLIYFGYPEASEQDPERAILAGLGIVLAVWALSPRPA